MAVYPNQTLSYSEDAKGWPSFYSFIPNYMVGMNGFFYSYSGGNLYRHNTNEIRNNYYGVQYNSTINSVFNIRPMDIKLFKTMSYESDDAWACTALFSDLGTGSMLSTFFEQKEGEWFTFLRENSGTVNWRDRSANGIGAAATVTGAAAATIITFAVDVGSILSIGDTVYVGANPPVLAGPVTAIVRSSVTSSLNVTTPASITVDCSAIPPADIPVATDFIVFIKDAVAESHGARGYYLNFTLENTNTEAVELFAVGGSVMKSYP